MSSSTNFLNSKQRRIFKSDKGSFFVKTAGGKKAYKPVAAFRKAGGEGAVRKLVAANSVPAKIAGAGVKGRATRKNKGVARLSPGTKAAGDAMRRMVAAAKRAAARNGAPRAVRKNKGVARGSKFGSAQATKMFADILNRTRVAPKAKAGARPARARAARKNAGVARGMRSPNQGVQYRMIFKTPPRRKSPKGKAMIGSPGGTMYKSAANMKRRAAVARKKRMLANNPFSMLANMRRRGAAQ
tara:strand:+ start:394 stop:1119 length:726 start_codon:yes stop_codon:yes gene_type:complete